jgi:predicted nucleic acid-binding protein
MERVFVDTSAWLALANRDDSARDGVEAGLRQRRGRLVTSNHVFDETVTFCASRLGHRAAVVMGGMLRNPAEVQIVHASVTDEQAAWELFQERTDRQYSFTDCISFVLMRRLKLSVAIAMDADFKREGFTVEP